MNSKQRTIIGLGILCLLAAGTVVNAQQRPVTDETIASTTVQAGRDTATGIGDAAVETSDAVKNSGALVAEKGHFIGAGSGALIGTVVSGDAKGTLIGGAVGGVGGGVVGHQME